jgi:hypothetical protein
MRKQANLSLPQFHVLRLPDGTEWAQFYRSAQGYLLRFPGLADFDITLDGKNISIWGVPGVSAPTLDHLYLNQVLPLALSRQFKLVLHASAVEIDEFAVAFLGESGRGKSTLAAAFATSGYRFLTDDGLQLEMHKGGYQAQPSHPSIRLWDDSCAALIPESTVAAPPIAYSGKARLLADERVSHCTTARALKVMYVLGTATVPDVSFNPIPAQSVLMTLVQNCFLLDMEEAQLLRQHFSQLAELTRSVRCFQLEYPRDFAELPHVMEAVARHARQLPHQGS